MELENMGRTLEGIGEKPEINWNEGHKGRNLKKLQKTCKELK